MIRADEINQKIAEDNGELLRKMEALIDAAIRLKFDGGTVEVNLLEVTSWPIRKAVVDALQRLYLGGGWRLIVEQHDGQDYQGGPSAVAKISVVCRHQPFEKD